MANQHAVLSPSSAERWFHCPGSVVLCAGLKDEGSAYAAEGTAAHFLAATCLNDRAMVRARDFVGAVIELCYHDASGACFERFQTTPPEYETDSVAWMQEMEIEVLGSVTVTEDMAEHVQKYVDYVSEVADGTGGLLSVEVAVPLDQITNEPDAKGTADALIVTRDELIVIDLKFGQGVEVSADENKQLLMYASGALRVASSIGYEDIVHVRLCVFQPRVSSKPSEWVCSVGHLKDFEDKTRVAAARVDNVVRGAVGNVEDWLIPSKDACRWCKAKATCPALANTIAAEVGADFDSLLTGSPPARVPESDSTNRLLAKKMACLDLIEDWCKAIRGRVEAELLLGNPVPGWKLVQGRRGARAWANEEDAIAALKRLRLKHDQMYVSKVISPTAAEKLLAAHEEKWAKITPLITQPEGKPSVAPENDKRPALIRASVVGDFSVVS